MPWDDELKELAIRARDTVGDDSFRKAFYRAGLTDISLKGPAFPDGDASPQAYEALKVELRRLLTERA